MSEWREVDARSPGFGAALALIPNNETRWFHNRWVHHQDDKIYVTGFGAGFEESPPDCGWAGQAYQDNNGNWKCPQVPGCGPGQVRDTNGNCVSAGVKRGLCGPNQAWNPVAGKCIDNVLSDDDCANDELVDAVTKKCAKMCPDGSRPRNGQCASTPDPIPPSKPPPGPGPVNPPTSSSISPWIIGAAVAGAGLIAYAAFAKKKKSRATARLG